MTKAEFVRHTMNSLGYYEEAKWVAQLEAEIERLRGILAEADDRHECVVCGGWCVRGIGPTWLHLEAKDHIARVSAPEVLEKGSDDAG